MPNKGANQLFHEWDFFRNGGSIYLCQIMFVVAKIKNTKFCKRSVEVILN